jgi:hypothetical protein
MITAALVRAIPERRRFTVFAISVALGIPLVAVSWLLATTIQDANQRIVWGIFSTVMSVGLLVDACILAALTSGRGHWFVAADLVISVAVIGGLIFVGI